MAGRKLAIALVVGVLLLAALPRLGGGAKHGLPRTDGWGDPFVTDAQGAAIRVGMSVGAAFRLLGGKGSPGWYYTGPGSIPTGVMYSYDYPIRGTDHSGPTTMLNDRTTWFRICVQGNSVVGKARVPPSSHSSLC
jgi:hypothetical protein